MISLVNNDISVYAQIEPDALYLFSFGKKDKKNTTQAFLVLIIPWLIAVLLHFSNTQCWHQITPLAGTDWLSNVFLVMCWLTTTDWLSNVSPVMGFTY